MSGLIGSRIAFQDRGVTREGRVVAVEVVPRGDRLGRTPGRWLTVRIGDSLFEDVDIPEAAVGAVLV